MADPAVNIILKATDQTKGVFTNVGNALGGLGKLALSAAVGGVALLGSAMAGGVVAATNWGNQLDTLQDLLGTTAEESAGLAVMANRVGLSSEDLGRSLSIMTRGLFDAEGAAGPAGDAIAGLGISVTDAAGNTKDSTVLFQEIADVIAKMPDGFEKSSLMMDIFGRSGVEMGDLLAAAADGGLAKFTEEADKLGLNFGQDKIDGIIEFGKQTEFLKSAFQGIAAQIGNAVLPVFSQLITENIMPFVEEHGPMLSAWLGENIPKALQFLADVWTNVLQPAITTVWTWMSTVLIPFLVDTVYPWLAVNIPIAVQFLSDVWNKVLLPAITAVWEWMSTVLIPFLVDVVYPWLQENIPKAIQFLSDVWENVLKPAIETVWNWMSTVLIPFLRDTVYPWLQEKVPAAIQTLTDFWEGTLLPAITSVWEFINTYIVPIFEDLWELLQVAGELATTAISVLWETTLKPALEKVWEFISENVIPILEDLWEWFSEKVGPIIQEVVDGALTNLKKIFKDIRDFIQFVIDKVLALIEKLKLIKMPKLSLPGIPTPQGEEFGANSIRAGSLAATNRLTVYGGLHLHGVDSGGDLLNSLSDLMIG